ncbi:unnamed protein product [Didymodactylos carnosus]|uniref:Uncharacterized protein n=1 Tax=Didymodactylos carnosus TaxID=1234261 RepID=A0A816AEF6_9BILA|nr:unnamed protein product [Didymodactylos carnosus]CAF4471288.1 unnamed protein product [Didymodactylos carnosus]
MQIENPSEAVKHPFIQWLVLALKFSEKHLNEFYELNKSMLNFTNVQLPITIIHTIKEYLNFGKLLRTKISSIRTYLVSNENFPMHHHLLHACENGEEIIFTCDLILEKLELLNKNTYEVHNFRKIFPIVHSEMSELFDSLMYVIEKFNRFYLANSEAIHYDIWREHVPVDHEPSVKAQLLKYLIVVDIRNDVCNISNRFYQIELFTEIFNDKSVRKQGSDWDIFFILSSHLSSQLSSSSNSSEFSSAERIHKQQKYSNYWLEEKLNSENHNDLLMLSTKHKHKSKQLNDQDMKIICEKLKINQHWKSLHICNTQITTKGVSYLCQALKVNSAIVTSLTLTNNQISDKGITLISKLMIKNKTIDSLNLGGNLITDKGVKQIAIMLKKNKTLFELRLQENLITDIGMELLIQALYINKGLDSLDVSSNDLTDDIVTSILNMLNADDHRQNFRLYIYQNQISELNQKIIQDKLKQYTLERYSNICKKRWHTSR